MSDHIRHLDTMEHGLGIVEGQGLGDPTSLDGEILVAGTIFFCGWKFMRVETSDEPLPPSYVSKPVMPRLHNVRLLSFRLSWAPRQVWLMAWKHAWVL